MLDIKLEPTRARPDLPISALLKHDSVEVIPNPAQGAALRQLGMLRTDDAALAGLSGSEGWMIDQLWPEVLADLGVHVASGEQAAWDLATSFQLAAWRAGERSYLCDEPGDPRLHRDRLSAIRA